MLHYRRWQLVVLAGVLGTLLFMLHSPEPCYSCSTSPPPPVACQSNMSAMTVRQEDQRDVWWDWFDDREEQTLNIYMGMNYVNGTNPLTATYRINASEPFVDAGLDPNQVTFDLQNAGGAGSNDTQIIKVPYGSVTNTQQIDITATLVDTNQECPTLPETVTTTVRLNPTGPTVWPIVPRSCPMPGEESQLAFGVRNPSDTEQTYNLVAYAENTDPYSGENSDVFNLNGTEGGNADLGMMTLEPGQVEQVPITCETFGYCFTGGENRVGIEVSPVGSGEQFDGAQAWMNVTLRDQEAECPVANDWWFLMPPWLLPLLIGAPLAALLLAALLLVGGGSYTLYKMGGVTPTNGGDGPPPPPKQPRKEPPRNTGSDGVTRN
jgi:hypothetical protein